MAELPSPLTPADCNLRGLPYMPLQVVILLDSDLFLKSTGDQFKAAVALWCKSWNQLPGGSLPNDDQILATLSGSKSWKKVKEMAMRGWFLCSDGRLYHKTVAENVLRAWESREDFQEKQDNKESRQERWRARVKQLTEQLRAIGVTPPAGAGLKALETLLERSLKKRNVDGNVDASVDADVDGKTSTRDKSEMSYKGREEKRRLTKNKSSDTSNSVDAAATSKPDDSISKNRKVQIAGLLRSLAIHPSTAAHPLVVEWAKNPKITDVLLAAAVAKARKHNDAKHISPNYLAPIIVEQLKPKADNAWQKSDQATDAKGRELGMTAHQYETYPEFRIRISDELRRRKHAAQAEGVTA